MGIPGDNLGNGPRTDNGLMRATGQARKQRARARRDHWAETFRTLPTKADPLLFLIRVRHGQTPSIVI
jgi:hypothetical protein